MWSLIQSHGDKIKKKLKPHPNHPNGRNPYAHICSLIQHKFGKSYKDICNEKVPDLIEFIEKISDWIKEGFFKREEILCCKTFLLIQISDTSESKIYYANSMPFGKWFDFFFVII